MQTAPVVYTIDAIEKEESKDIDREKLVSYLNKNLSEEADWSKCKIYRCTSGFSNPPYIINCGPGSKRYVLRMKRTTFSKLIEKHNIMLDIKQQYKLISLLDKFTDIPVPKMCIFCDDENVIGTTFYMMEFINGRLFTHCAPDLPTLPLKDRAKVYKEMTRVLASIHSIDYNKINGFYDIIKDQLPRHIEECWSEWKDECIEAANDKNMSQKVDTFNGVINEKIIEYKEDNKNLEFTTLCHGDFHTENVIWDPVEYKIIAVVDREMCSVGNPLYELVYLLRNYASYETETIRKMEPKLEFHSGFKYMDVKKLGIPTENEQIMNYLSDAKKVLSPLLYNKMILWYKKKNNWCFASALLKFQGIGMLNSILSGEENNRISDVIRDRQYQLCDAAAETGLDLFKADKEVLYLIDYLLCSFL